MLSSADVLREADDRDTVTRPGDVVVELLQQLPVDITRAKEGLSEYKRRLARAEDDLAAAERAVCGRRFSRRDASLEELEELAELKRAFDGLDSKLVTVNATWFIEESERFVRIFGTEQDIEGRVQALTGRRGEKLKFKKHVHDKSDRARRQIAMSMLDGDPHALAELKLEGDAHAEASMLISARAYQLGGPRHPEAAFGARSVASGRDRCFRQLEQGIERIDRFVDQASEFLISLATPDASPEPSPTTPLVLRPLVQLHADLLERRVPPRQDDDTIDQLLEPARRELATIMSDLHDAPRDTIAAQVEDLQDLMHSVRMSGRLLLAAKHGHDELARLVEGHLQTRAGSIPLVAAAADLASDFESSIAAFAAELDRNASEFAAACARTRSMIISEDRDPGLAKESD